MTVMINITVIVLVIKTAITTAQGVTVIWNGDCNDILANNEQMSSSCKHSSAVMVNIFSQLVQMGIMPFLFLAFLEFTNELTNPFGTDHHDFPRLAYLTGMRNENQGFFDMAGKGSAENV